VLGVRGSRGQFCTITSSNLEEIVVGARVIYPEAAGEASLDTDVTLDAGSGNIAAGHVVLDIASDNLTGALDHGHSACAASGLNDFDTEEGQNESQVQTAADSWRYYGFAKGDVGRLGLCRGGPPE
jgi:hypothetical protein